MISAPPHDMLKVYKWKEHTGRRCEEHLPGEFKSKCPHLTEIIKNHHEARGEFRAWAEADRAASAVSRLRMEFSYWDRDLTHDPFLVKVYGPPKYWSADERERLWKDLTSIYFREGENDRSHSEANEKVKEYPQDSRFPFVSLATHHWVTWIFYKRLEESGAGMLNTVYVVRLSIPEPSFHRLRDKREFFEKRDAFLRGLSMRLENLNSLRIGDDLYLLLTSKEGVNATIREVHESKVPCDVDVYTYELENVREVEGRTLRRPQLRIRSYNVHVLSSGMGEDWAFQPSKGIEWVRYLNFPYVAWISLKPLNDLHGSAKAFLEWAEHRVLSSASFREPEEVPLKSDVPASPELLFSVAQGYDEFLSEFAREVDKRVRPEAVTIVRSLSRSIFIYGLNRPSEAVDLYLRLSKKVEQLHIPVILSIVVAEPDHPFWHVLGLFSLDNIVFVTGGGILSLPDEFVKNVRDVIPVVKGMSRGSFYRILRAVKRANKEELKLLIDGLAADEKLGKEGQKIASKLCWLIDDIASKHTDEDDRKDVTYRSFRLLAYFTRKD